MPWGQERERARPRQPARAGAWSLLRGSGKGQTLVPVPSPGLPQKHRVIGRPCWRGKGQDRDCFRLKKFVPGLNAAFLAAERRSQVAAPLVLAEVGFPTKPWHHVLCVMRKQGSLVPPHRMPHWLAAFLAVGERHETIFGKGYACLHATGIDLVSVRYLLYLQGVLPTSTGKIALPTGSLFTSLLS